MDKNISERTRAPEGIIGAARLEIGKRKKEPRLLMYDSLIFVLNFVLSRFHLMFGAYPMSLSFIAASPTRVWVSLLGNLVGAISRGKDGIIHGALALIVVFLRIIISGGETKNGSGRALFSEALVFRVSSSVIGAFVGSVYELLLGGLSSASILYSLTACGFGAIFTIIFYGLFQAGIGFDDVIFSKDAVFEKKRSGREMYNWIFFQISFLILLFFISLSIKEFTVLGIDLAYVFSAFLALFVAKRFGAVRAMAIGFVSSFGVSSTLSVAFALAGLGAGALFPIAPVYAFFASGALLSVWSSYTGGMVGFLSVFPEFATAAALLFPFLKSLEGEKREQIREDIKKNASDMIASVALSHRNERGGCVDKLTSSVSSVAGAIRRFGKNESSISREEIRDSLVDAARESCPICRYYGICKSLNPAPCAEIIDELSINIYKNGKISKQDIGVLPEYCKNEEYIMERFSDAFGNLSSTKYKGHRLTELSDEYELISKMINEARRFEERSWQLDKALSEKLDSALCEVGLPHSLAKAFGERKKRIVAAGEDKTGEIISSEELKKALEKVIGARLGTPEFFRKGDVALMDVSLTASYSVEYAESSATAPESLVSGDTAASFISDDGYFYSLISDGMGSGELARSASQFVYEFLKAMLSASISENTALYVLNNIIRNKREECSATLDLFRFDLLYGEAIFVKSGAVASYVKRENSLFRIRSETAPLGLMKTIDSEKIRVEFKSGDIVVMFSDGVADSPESSVWLPELLAKPFEGSLKEYADFILEAAKKNSRSRDDMTVALAKIRKLK